MLFVEPSYGIIIIRIRSLVMWIGSTFVDPRKRVDWESEILSYGIELRLEKLFGIWVARISLCGFDGSMECILRVVVGWSLTLLPLQVGLFVNCAKLKIKWALGSTLLPITLTQPIKELIGSSAHVSWSKVVWHRSSLPKARFIFWMAMLNKLKTKDHLMRIDVTPDDCCPLCCTACESIAHFNFLVAVLVVNALISWLHGLIYRLLLLFGQFIQAIGRFLASWEILLFLLSIALLIR